MNWDTWVMPAIVLGLATLGAIGTWFTLKAKNDEHGVKIAELGTAHGTLETSLRSRVESVSTELAAYKLYVSDRYVIKDDLRQVEDRIAKRIDTVEHTVRNTAAQIISALSVGPGRRSSGRPIE